MLLVLSLVITGAFCDNTQALGSFPRPQQVLVPSLSSVSTRFTDVGQEGLQEPEDKPDP